MAKKKFSVNKDDLYQKIMPASTVSPPNDTSSPPTSVAVPAISVAPSTTAPDLSINVTATIVAPVVAEDAPAEIDTPAVAEDAPAEIDTPAVAEDVPAEIIVGSPEQRPINLVEKIVLSHIYDVLKNNGGCTCDKCQKDAAALALNRIPAKYISPFSPSIALTDFYYKQHFAEIICAMNIAAEMVKKNPQH